MEVDLRREHWEGLKQNLEQILPFLLFLRDNNATHCVCSLRNNPSKGERRFTDRGRWVVEVPRAYAAPHIPAPVYVPTATYVSPVYPN